MDLQLNDIFSSIFENLGYGKETWTGKQIQFFCIVAYIVSNYRDQPETGTVLGGRQIWEIREHDFYHWRRSYYLMVDCFKLIFLLKIILSMRSSVQGESWIQLFKYLNICKSAHFDCDV